MKKIAEWVSLLREDLINNDMRRCFMNVFIIVSFFVGGENNKRKI